MNRSNLRKFTSWSINHVKGFPPIHSAAIFYAYDRPFYPSETKHMSKRRKNWGKINMLEKTANN
jgi:hypothetical protein